MKIRLHGTEDECLEVAERLDGGGTILTAGQVLDVPRGSARMGCLSCRS